MSSRNTDPFAKSATPPLVHQTGVDGNFNQVSQQNAINKTVVNGVQQDIANPFPFSRSSTQKSGNVRFVTISVFGQFIFAISRLKQPVGSGG